MTILFIIASVLLAASLTLNWYLWQQVQILSYRLRSHFRNLPKLLIAAGIAGAAIGKIIQHFATREE